MFLTKQYPFALILLSAKQTRYYCFVCIGGPKTIHTRTDLLSGLTDSARGRTLAYYAGYQ